MIEGRNCLGEESRPCYCWIPWDHPAAGKGLVDGKPALYVCRNSICRPSIVDAAAFDP